MSADASAYVWRFCPFKGATFAVHSAIADSVNDQHDYLAWMTQKNLAKKARTSVRSVHDALAALESEGFLVRVGGGQEAGSAVQFRFIFKRHIPPVYEPRRGSAKAADPSATVARGSAKAADRTQVKPQVEPQPPSVEQGSTAVDEPSKQGDRVRAVFAAWQLATGHMKAVLDGRRRRLIEKALALYPFGDVMNAVQGWKHSPYHRGENERNTVYNDLELLLRNASKIEFFRDLQTGAVQRAPQRSGPAPTTRCPSCRKLTIDCECA